MKSFFTTFCFLILFLVSTFTDSFAQTNWTKYANNPVMKLGSEGSWNDAGYAPGCILFDGSTYHAWWGGTDGETSRVGYFTSPDGIYWTEYAGNPVLNVGSAGSWDDEGVYRVYVRFDGELYHMWYTGWSGTRDNIGYATSPDGITWTKYAGNPVLNVGSAGSWEEDDVLSPCVRFDGANYHMWYEGANWPNSSIGYATSPDGLAWTKYASNPVLIGKAGNWDYPRVEGPTVYFDGATYHMWYTGAAGIWLWRIGYATSPDGITWTKYGGRPVLDKGDPGDWDDKFAAFGTVVVDTVDHLFKIWYGGGRENVKAVIGYAVDFSNIAHSDSISISSTYLPPDVDTLKINARIVNPDEHTLTAMAQIVSDDSTIVDSTNLSDNGDGIWSGKWPVPEGERTYRVGIKTIDEASGMIHNGLLWNIEKFTTLGPIKYESHIGERGGFGDSRYELSLSLHNESNTTTAEGVSATLVLIFEDTCYSNMTIPTSEFDDIAPGQTGESNDKYIVQLEGVCRNNNILLTFRVDIAMDGYVFWQDTLMVDIPTNLEEFDENLLRKFALKQKITNYQLQMTWN
jgi:predicted GH43/DUF377 family glycosyl hydrolase